jgi:hypothetical protein
MKTLSATDLAIAKAERAGYLRITTRTGRFGPFVAIEDDFGVIEVANDKLSAAIRINTVLDQLDPYKLESRY